jgi:hypothetical protein
MKAAPTIPGVTYISYEMMKIYLGKDPDISEAIEFLCLAQAGEITHYEVLNAMTSEIKNK